MKSLPHNSGPPSLKSLIKTADEKHLRIPRLQVAGLDDKLDRKFAITSQNVLPQFHR